MSNPLDSYYDPLRGKLVLFPERWPPTARRHFLRRIGEFAAEEMTRRALLDRRDTTEAETPPP